MLALGSRCTIHPVLPPPPPPPLPVHIYRSLHDLVPLPHAPSVVDARSVRAVHALCFRISLLLQPAFGVFLFVLAIYLFIQMDAVAWSTLSGTRVDWRQTHPSFDTVSIVQRGLTQRARQVQGFGGYHWLLVHRRRLLQRGSYTTLNFSFGANSCSLATFP